MEKILKFICVSKTKYAILPILLLVFTFFCAYSYVDAVSTNLENNLFRLHVIANSDNKEDQDLKYIVRDATLKYVNELSEKNNINTKEELILLVTENKENIKKLAEQTIIDNGYNYTVNISIGNFNFPTKEYGDISLPNGFYDALRIEIGNASGQNWWCVMFPPLCFVDVSSGIVPEESKETLQQNLSEEEYTLLTKDSTDDLKLKFKIIEIFHKINISTAKK